MPNGARVQVAPPRVDPLPFGLLSVAQLVPEGSPHWRNGSWFQADACGPAEITLDSCPNPALNYTKPPTVTGILARGADTMTAYAYIDCSPVGNFDEYEARTRRALELGAPRAIEKVFWSGVADVPAASGTPVYPHLASSAQVFDTILGSGTNEVLLQPAAVVVSGSGAGGLAVGVVEAIGLLEEAMGASYGGVPTVHMPRAGLSHLSSHFLLNLQGGFANTPSGTKINAGGGNLRLGPTGAVAPVGQAWFYATGAIEYRRSEVSLTSTSNQALRRNVNSMRLIAEQTYQFNWDCGLYAVLVDLTGGN